MQQARSNKNVSAKSYMRGYREIYDVIKPIHSEMSISGNARSIRFTFAYSMTIFGLLKPVAVAFGMTSPKTDTISERMALLSSTRIMFADPSLSAAVDSSTPTSTSGTLAKRVIMAA